MPVQKPTTLMNLDLHGVVECRLLAVAEPTNTVTFVVQHANNNMPVDAATAQAMVMMREAMKQK